MGFPPQKVVFKIKSSKELQCFALGRLRVCGNLTSKLVFEYLFS